MISKIKDWFSSVGFVYMLFCGQWIGRPKDNVYFLKDCYEIGGILVLDLGDGWVMECDGDLSLKKSGKELVIFSSTIRLLIDGKESKIGSCGEVKFFVD